MSYRVECSPNSRAGCQNKPCKDEGIKIEKGEIRFGVYVTIQDHGSFRWKHWGCVSGVQLQGLRDYLEQDDPSTGFKWDLFDGLDELPVDQQAKVKAAIIEGKIADEDWKGDPSYNKLGQKGTQPVVRKKKPKYGEEGEGEEEGTPPSSDEKPAPKKRAPAKKKATQKTEDGNEDEADTKPAAKKRAPAKKKAVKEEDGEPDEDVKPTKPPAKKAAAKEAKNEESGDEETKPIKKTPAKKTRAVNKEESGEESAGNDAAAQEGVKPTKKTLAKKSAAKKKVKKVYDEDNSGEDEAQAEAKPAPPSRAERASKRAASDPNDENKKPVKKRKTAKAPAQFIDGLGENFEAITINSNSSDDSSSSDSSSLDYDAIDGSDHSSDQITKDYGDYSSSYGYGYGFDVFYGYVEYLNKVEYRYRSWDSDEFAMGAMVTW